MKHKSSPVFVAVFLYRFVFLLLTLLLQAAVLEGVSPEATVYMYRLDIFLLIILCLWAVVCYRSISYSTCNGILRVQKGVLTAQDSKVPFSTFDSLQITANPLFRLFKVCKVQTTASKSHTTLYLNRKATKKLTDFFCSDTKKKAERLSSDFFSVLIFSAGFSGALTGLLSAIPLLRNISGLLGERNTRNILANADLWVYTGYTALPPFLRTLSTLFLWAWGIGTFVELNRYLHLKTSFYNDRIVAQHGLFTKHLSVHRKAVVSCLVFKQSILLYLLRLYTAEAYLPVGRREVKLPLLLASRKNKCKDTLHALHLPIQLSSSPCTKPPDSSLWGYVWKPLLFLSFISLLCILPDMLTPYRIEIHLMLFTTLWGCVWFLFSAFAHRHSAVFCDNIGIIIRSAKGLSLTQAHIPLNKIRAVKITQNIFQKRNGVCNLYVYIRSNKKQAFLIKHIDKNKTAQLILK